MQLVHPHARLWRPSKRTSSGSWLCSQAAFPAMKHFLIHSVLIPSGEPSPFPVLLVSAPSHASDGPLGTPSLAIGDNPVPWQFWKFGIFTSLSKKSFSLVLVLWWRFLLVDAMTCPSSKFGVAELCICLLTKTESCGCIFPSGGTSSEADKGGRDTL